MIKARAREPAGGASRAHTDSAARPGSSRGRDLQPAGTLHSLQTIRLQEHTAAAAVADFLYSGVGSDHLVFQQPAICLVTVETFNDQ